MRNAVIFFTVILIMGVSFQNLLSAGSPGEEELDKDNFGKVVGQLVDAENGTPVKARVYLFIHSGKIDQFSKELTLFPTAESDQNGCFSLEVNPGQYYLYCKPMERNSWYCEEPYPFLYNEPKNPFDVERGKITKVVKEVHLGGSIKVQLVDSTGMRLNPKEISKSVDIDLRLYNVSTNIQYSKFHKNGDINLGETTLKGIFPDNYNLVIHFSGLGVAPQIKQGLVVERKKTIEVQFSPDMDDVTGVHGTVSTENGAPLESVEVRLCTPNAGRISMTYTDNSGYYRIVGASEGAYFLVFFYRFPGKRSYYHPPGQDIYIKKDALTQVNKVLNID